MTWCSVLISHYYREQTWCSVLISHYYREQTWCSVRKFHREPDQPRPAGDTECLPRSREATTRLRLPTDFSVLEYHRYKSVSQSVSVSFSDEMEMEYLFQSIDKFFILILHNTFSINLQVKKYFFDIFSKTINVQSIEKKIQTLVLLVFICILKEEM